MIKYNPGLFDIVTLSDRARARNFPKLQTHYLRHGSAMIKRKRRLGDPVAIIMAGAQIFGQLFPNLFGNSAPATMDDFIQMFPGSGLWTTKFREYLQANIKYKKDIQRDLYLYTERFVKANHQQLYPETAIENWGVGQQKFYNILRQEAAGGGSQVYPGEGLNWQAYLPYILIGGVALIALSNKKKK